MKQYVVTAQDRMPSELPDGLKLHRFDENDAPEVLTTVSPECDGGNCAGCQGILTVPEYGDEPIFCVHWCHRVGGAA
jgi:hypothetical protein